MTMRGTNQEEDWLEERWERLTHMQTEAGNECHDDETYIPATARDAYDKVVSAAHYCLFVLWNWDAYRLLNPVRDEMVKDGGDWNVDVDCNLANADYWTSYAAQQKGEPIEG